MGTAQTQGELWGAKARDWFAGDVGRALREARRVCRREGTVAMLVWGHRQDCDLCAVTFPAVVALLPPPPAPAAAAKALSEPGVIEAMMDAADLVPTASGDIDGQFVYPDADTACRANASAGMIVRAIRFAGEAAVRRAILETLAGFTRPDGSVVPKIGSAE